MSPLVSILIPAYNAAPFLKRSVGSALAQTYANIEVVIVDDGSTDDTTLIADDLAAQDHRVRVVHQSNQGPAEARRTAFKASTGDYIAYLDADDELLPEAITFLYDKIAEYRLDLAFGSMIKVVGEKSFKILHAIEGVLTGDEFLHYLFDRRCMCAQGEYLCKREAWSDAVFPTSGDVFPNEDVLMYILLSEHVSRVGFFNVPTMKYYYVPTSLTSTSRLLGSLDGWEAFFGHVENNLCRRGKLEELGRELLCMKIDRIAFYIYPLDASRPWISDTLKEKRYHLPLRYTVLQRLLRYPRLCHGLVITNRRMKKLLKRF